jgi:hypothetical protein
MYPEPGWGWGKNNIALSKGAKVPHDFKMEEVKYQIQDNYGLTDSNWDLPPMGADPSKVTTNGIGSGGFMAMQALVTFSDLFAGAELEESGSFSSLKFLS